MTFTPSLNPRSIQMAQKMPDFNIPVYERLFQRVEIIIYTLNA